MYGKNPRINELIKELKELSRKKDVDIWKDIAERLKKPTQNYSEINVSKINRHTGDEEKILVPGKVLGTGRINKELKIAALNFSETAEKKITEAGGTAVTIEELMKSDPEGTEIKIMGWI